MRDRPGVKYEKGMHLKPCLVRSWFQQSAVDEFPDRLFRLCDSDPAPLMPHRVEIEGRRLRRERAQASEAATGLVVETFRASLKQQRDRGKRTGSRVVPVFRGGLREQSRGFCKFGQQTSHTAPIETRLLFDQPPGDAYGEW